PAVAPKERRRTPPFRSLRSRTPTIHDLLVGPCARAAAVRAHACAAGGHLLANRFPGDRQLLLGYAVMLTLVSWNMARREAAWRELPHSGADVALLQEAAAPPADCGDLFDCDNESWRTGSDSSSRKWRTSIVRLNPKIEMHRVPVGPIDGSDSSKLRVSYAGTISAASVSDPQSGESLTAVSVYAAWEAPPPNASARYIYADAAAHRVISDVAALLDERGRHRIIVAGDLNILYGHGERGNPYWRGRYRTVFDRLDSMGLAFVGPQSPNGRQASPWPDELPTSSLNVPTYHTNRQTPTTATRQLDFVFASKSIASRVRVTARNSPDDWGRATTAEW